MERFLNKGICVRKMVFSSRLLPVEHDSRSGSSSSNRNSSSSS